MNKSETMLSPTNMSDGDITRCRALGAQVDRRRRRVNEDMRIEALQMLLGDMGPPVLKRNDGVYAPDAKKRDIGRTQARIDKTVVIQKWWKNVIQHPRKKPMSQAQARKKTLEMCGLDVDEEGSQIEYYGELCDDTR